jgi:hypothetical protein
MYHITVDWIYNVLKIFSMGLFTYDRCSMTVQADVD